MKLVTTPAAQRAAWFKRIQDELRLVLVALQFLTRVPVRFSHFEDHWLHESARYFPLIGLLVGAAAVLSLALALQCWPPFIAVILCTATTMVLTGAFHEDGLADTFDALGGAVSRERALQIMKDSRIGTYGALALLLVVSLKITALLELAQRGFVVTAAALLFAHTSSRVVTVLLLNRLRYAGDLEQAKAKPLAQYASSFTVVMALMTVLLLAAFLLWLDASLAPAVGASSLTVLLVAGLCALWYQRRLGGYSGDSLGAAQQLSELSVYLLWSTAIFR